MSKNQEGDAIELVPLQANVRCDIALQKYFDKKFSRSQIQNWIKNGLVSFDGSVITKTSFQTSKELLLSVRVPAEQEYSLTALDLSLEIVYEDENLAVINKPCGLTVHPGAGVKADTLAHALLHRFTNLSDINGNLRPGIVHRLDKETSGLLLIAKNNFTHRRLAKLFHDRKIIKRYRAWVKGTCSWQEKRIDGFIARDLKNRVKMRFDQKQIPGILNKQASLIISAVKTIGNFSLLDIQLLTGRTHQIRATLQFLKLPIINDTLYGFAVRDKKLSSQEMLLQAYHLQFFLEKNFDFTLGTPLSFSHFEEYISHQK